MNARTHLTVDMPQSTPWGMVNHYQPIAQGIVYVDTAGHGGFWLSPERLAKVPADHRMARFGRARTMTSPWFEHDCDWIFAVLAHEEVFNAATVKEAKRLWKSWGQERVQEYLA